MSKRRSFQNSSSSTDEASPNLTPLIDVVFVVLIMFIIIAPMLEVDKVSLAAAAPHEVKKAVNIQESSPITIHVRADNTILLNSLKVQPDELVLLLKNAKRQNPNKIPQLFHDKKAYFGTYQLVKNAVEISGFDELDVILQPGP